MHIFTLGWSGSDNMRVMVQIDTHITEKRKQIYIINI